MKKALLSLFILLALTSVVFAAADDIAKTEARPSVTTYRLDTVTLAAFSEMATITYRKGYMDGTTFVSTGGYEVVTFTNIADNPATPENEATTEFSQFITYIQNRIDAGDTLKVAITKACKIKLGL
jgi:hypothetical protein